jgi:hypothetical protein
MKLSTRQYARKQIKWIRNKLLPVVNITNRNATMAEDNSGEVVPMYLLDATGLLNLVYGGARVVDCPSRVGRKMGFRSTRACMAHHRRYAACLSRAIELS